MSAGRPWGIGQAARSARLLALVALAALGLTACASNPAREGPGYATAGAHGTDKPYQVDGRWYYPHAQPGYDEVGSASWYGQDLHNRRTADGEVFDQNALSAAHKTLPLPCMVEVTNLDNGRRLQLRVNDRGPFVGDRILDVSRGAADALGFRGRGLTRVRVRYLGPAGPVAPMIYARAAPAVRPPPSPILEAAEAEDDEDPVPPRAAEQMAPVDPDPAALPPSSVFASSAPAAPAYESPAAGAYEVQAAAFANLDNAQRAADRLSHAGAASIKSTTTSDGLVLYRVVLTGFGDPQSAEAARAQVAEAGFADAKVITPF